MNDIEKLKTAIRDLHGCDSVHIASIAVHETFEGKTVWKGVVEIFSLMNHPKVKEAYAWSYESDTGETRYVTFLGVPPINSAYVAVRDYIIAQGETKWS